MKRLPLVSIITPSYNQGEFIKDAILSVKSQRYQEIEHIIIDGASNDNTLDIIKKYEGTYNMRWISEPDNGPIEATNKGVGMSQGGIRCHLNTDDLFFPWTVSVVVDYFQRYPDIEVVYSDLLGMNLDTGKNWIAFQPQYNFPLLRRRGLSSSAGAFFRSSVFSKVGFYNENLPLDADHEFCVKVDKQCRVAKIEEVLTVDRIHAKSLRITQHQKLVEERKSIKQNLPEGQQGYLSRIRNFLLPFAVKKLLRLKFAYYYLTRNRLLPLKGRPTYPWQNFIESSGIHNFSWFTFLATTIPGARYFRFILKILPWARRGYKGNWFAIDITGDYAKK